MRSSQRKYGAALDRLDEHLLNHEHPGFLAPILPSARVIDCRRDPADTCISCFLEPLAAADHLYACDVAHLGARYRQHERVLEHWRSVLELRLLQLDYESIIADQEGQTRRLIDFLDLPWDKRCLRYHESSRVAQTLSRARVRQPIYRASVERSERFAAHLDPLHRALVGE